MGIAELKAPRILVSLLIALLLACFLCVARGGFAIFPFIVFFLAGFAALIMWQIFSRRQTQAGIEMVLRTPPHSLGIRYTLVFCLLVSLAIWSGPAMMSLGVGGWLITLLVWLLALAVICPVAPRFPVLFGILATGCIWFSLSVEGSRLYSLHREIQWSHVFDHPAGALMMWGIGAAFSLIISVPVYVYRRAA